MKVRQSTESVKGEKKNKVDRALLLQQREQLKMQVLNRFLSDYGRGKESNNQVIRDLVETYFQNQKVNESSLKQLKQQVIDATGGKNPSLYKSTESVPSVKAHKGDNSTNPNRPDSQTSKKLSNQQKPSSQSQQRINEAGNQQHLYETQSNMSSKAPKSVYMGENEEDNEWATLVKFDTQLYRKEQELEKQRQKELRKKLKVELDKQLDEKHQKKFDEVKDEEAYVNLASYQQKVQIAVYDQREQEKTMTMKQKIQFEKMQRDKQVRDEYQRKKLEQKREKELDDLLVKKIREELELEQQEINQKRYKEKERLQQMIKENEEYRKKAMKEAKEEKEAETQMQKQYLYLQEQLENQREQEKKQREDKMKKVMGVYAESVVKDQKDLMKQEDEKMLRNILDQNDKEKQEEERKKKLLLEQKQSIREFLNQQIREKNQKIEEEQQLNRKQADIWKQDLESYNQHEKKKHDYIKEVNQKHAEILKQQMDQRKKVKPGVKVQKMNKTELLQNKDKLKLIAEHEPEENLKKIEINA